MGRPLVVGFDLDMTLIDSRPGIGAVYRRLAEETGVAVDVATVVGRLGPPVADELAHWFPPEDVPRLADRYRQLYPELAIAASPALPGAVDALAAVRARGGTTLVVTAKHGANARLHVERLRLPVDEVIGDRWSAGKGEALLERGAGVFVGDQPSDVYGAKVAGAVAVGVATGSATADRLREAGADVVLSDLTEFPAWFDEITLP